MELAVKEANENGFNIKLTCTEVEGGEERLKQITQLINQAAKDPLFEKELKDKDVQSQIERAFDKNFDVFVVATMSSGKSTLINAMLGCKVLPALNKATTATIAKIYDNDTMATGEFNARVYHDKTLQHDEALNLAIKAEADAANKKMTDWNKSTDTSCIKLEGKIVGVMYA